MRTGKRLPLYFTKEEAEAFLEAAATVRYAIRGLAMFRLVLQTGCRVGELLTLTLDRLDLVNRTRVGDREREQGTAAAPDREDLPGFGGVPAGEAPFIGG